MGVSSGTASASLVGALKYVIIAGDDESSIADDDASSLVDEVAALPHRAAVVGPLVLEDDGLCHPRILFLTKEGHFKETIAKVDFTDTNTKHMLALLDTHLGDDASHLMRFERIKIQDWLLLQEMHLEAMLLRLAKPIAIKWKKQGWQTHAGAGLHYLCHVTLYLHGLMAQMHGGGMPQQPFDTG
jgi:hypothetical protein